MHTVDIVNVPVHACRLLNVYMFALEMSVSVSLESDRSENHGSETDPSIVGFAVLKPNLDLDSLTLV